MISPIQVSIAITPNMDGNACTLVKMVWVGAMNPTNTAHMAMNGG